MNKINFKKLTLLLKQNKITDINFDLANALAFEVVFYNLANSNQKINQCAFDLFFERLSLSKSLVVIINIPVNLLKGKDRNNNDNNNKNVKIFCADHFLQLKKSITDFLYKTNVMIKVIGITGTNGKTSTTQYISQFLREKNENVLVFGTNGIFFNEQLMQKSDNTTPDYIVFKKSIHNIVQKKTIEQMFVVLEISSHALVQNRLIDLELDISAVTNITQDHLDYHKNMEAYILAKLSILKVSKKFLYFDDFKQKKFLLRLEYDCKVFEIDYDDRIFLKIHTANFIKRNIFLAASIVSKALNININSLNFNNLKNPEGRFERIGNLDSRLVFVDYAHTPDASLHVLSNLRTLYPMRKIITVFGCGGDRDISKRSLMGEICFQYSDFIIITNDNPRTEKAEKIVSDIVNFKQFRMYSNYKIILDRSNAIENGMKLLTKNNLLVILGKGHEDYQIIGHEKKYFKDKDVVLNYY